MTTMQVDDDAVVLMTETLGDYSRPAWTAELRRVEAQILAAAGVTWS